MQYKVCVLGAGSKPLTKETAESFGLKNRDFIATNVDIVPFKNVDVVQDLNNKVWNIGEYDLVIAEHVAEHMKDRIGFIRNCLRHTYTGGEVIIEVPNWSHEAAHSNLEHLTTWNRVIFDDSYINRFGLDWKLQKVVYRITNPITWKSYYIRNEFIGRQLDKYTRLISGLRFFLRKP